MHELYTYRHDAQYSGFSYAPRYSTFGIHYPPTSPKQYEHKDTSNTQGMEMKFTICDIIVLFSVAYGWHGMWSTKFPSGWPFAVVFN